MSNKLMDFFLKEVSYYRRTAVKITKGNPFLAEELLQELAVAILEHKGEVNNYKSFLNMCMSNEYRQYIAVSRNKTFQDAEQFEAKHENITDKGPLFELERNRLIKAIVAGTSTNRKMDYILRRKILDGDSYKEISAELNTNEQTTKSHITINKRSGRLNWLKELL